MRDILFRGKTYNGDWVEGSYYKQTEYYGDAFEAHYIISSSDELEDNMMTYDRVIPKTLGQYTGTTDQNGKKIFEGDILSIMFESDRIDGFSSYTWYESADVVFSEEKHAWIVVFEDGGEEMYLNEYDDMDDVWVIGNIHDEPEHLKGELNMTLEAVWFKNGKEICWVDPVIDLVCEGNMHKMSDIEVYNGYAWYSSADCGESPDDFVIRVKKDV